MDSIFTMTRENIEFFDSLPSMKTCLERIGDAPYWTIINRICYHNHEDPVYIIHNHIVLDATNVIKTRYESYFHVFPKKKKLYAASHYSINELKDIASRLLLPVEGSKNQLYASISERIVNEFKHDS